MRENNPSFQVHSILTGMVGRRRLEISYEQLSFLIENRFSVPQIADMIGVSIRTMSAIFWIFCHGAHDHILVDFGGAELLFVAVLVAGW